MKKLPHLLLIGLCLFASDRAMAQSSFPSVELAKDQVKMKIYIPDAEAGYYQATRFDWSGVIASARYMDHEYFGYWKDTHDPKVHEDLSGPVEGYIEPGLGYAEAKPGEGFLRIGVGVIEKVKEEKYDAFKTYRILDHGKWDLSHGSDWIEFRHQASVTSGYSYRYMKRIELMEAGFKIFHNLQNTGTQKIETDQFNHNFFMIDGETAGPNLEVSFPYAIMTEYDLKNLMRIEGQTLLFNRDLNEDRIYMELTGYGESANDHSFTVKNTNSGAGIKVSLDQPVYRMVFWSCNTTYCPENFIWISVDPGQEMEWTSEYTFQVN